MLPMIANIMFWRFGLIFNFTTQACILFSFKLQYNYYFSLLSQPVDGERVIFALQFVLGYQCLLERLRDAARSRDPRTLQTFRQLKQRGKSLHKVVPGFGRCKLRKLRKNHLYENQCLEKKC